MGMQIIGVISTIVHFSLGVDASPVASPASLESTPPGAFMLQTDDRFTASKKDVPAHKRASVGGKSDLNKKNQQEIASEGKMALWPLIFSAVDLIGSFLDKEKGDPQPSPGEFKKFKKFKKSKSKKLKSKKSKSKKLKSKKSKSKKVKNTLKDDDDDDTRKDGDDTLEDDDDTREDDDDTRKDGDDTLEDDDDTREDEDDTREDEDDTHEDEDDTREDDDDTREDEDDTRKDV
ncbi:hypothetical protein DSO57_1016932 [Entomophthora muscae]|uniref:Uncharacterized protein n=1 Tax=Entomophthora muscae TaxID=34485 RepID=A0ACC2STI1_9FUNG|nr:hypothetical protein DSO57_1016932 [Entomophthora muscae]